LWRAWATRSKRPGRVTALPAERWTLPRVVVQASAVERYRDVCGLAAEHGVPLTYPQLLTFPLVMAYLCSPECPWPAVGTVHLANVIEEWCSRVIWLDQGRVRADGAVSDVLPAYLAG